MKAKIWNHSGWVKETSPEELKKFCGRALRASGFNILDFCEHYFNPFGYTCLFLLGESHLAVHTFPEENKTYIELSSCNEKYFNLFLDFWNRELPAADAEAE